MALVVGLDIGTKTIKGAVLSGVPKKFRLVDFFVEEIRDLNDLGADSEDGPPSSETFDIDSDLPSSVGETIKRALAERGLENADVVASLDTQNCIVREIWVPFTRDDQIAKTLTFEAENSLVTFDVEEMILEYHKFEERDGKSHLVLLAAREQAVGDRLEMLKEADVDPVALDLDSAALFNSYALTPTYDPERTTLLVDIGATMTKVLLIQDGTLAKVRAIRLGAFLGGFDRRQLAEGEDPKTSDGDGSRAPFEFPAASSIEARFDEIENALRRLDPLGSGARTGLVAGEGSVASETDAAQETALEPRKSLETSIELDEELLSLVGSEEPIAILTDDEFDRLAETTERAPGAEEDFEPDPDVESDVGEAASRLASIPQPLSQNAEEPSNGSNGKGASYRMFLERLGQEIQRTFAMNFIRSPVELICLTGGMCRRREAAAFFRDEFDVETIPFEFGDRFEMEVDVEQREQVSEIGAVAVGLAAKELGQDQLGFDFRKGPFRYERRFEKLKYPLLLTGILLCAFFLQLVFDLISEYQYWGQRAQKVHSRELLYYDGFWGDLTEAQKLRRSTRLAAASEQVKKKLEATLQGGADLPKYIDEVTVMADIRDVFQRARKQGVNFTIQSITLKLQTRTRRGNKPRGAAARNAPKIQADSSQIVVIADEWGDGGRFREFFRSSRIFDADPGESPAGDNRVKVTLQLKPKDSYLLSLDSGK